ncbi:hypothetical protein L4D76_24895 [Photobacterium sagamiensis]|uniref:hypothetical protein n=1 Tax=Photobacterium sagamiensis TaxID=2910241 RepID=UPI003D0D2967
MTSDQLVWLSGIAGAVGIILLQQIIKIAGSSYLKKKGENLATKEDIKEITKQVEFIKAKFDIQTEMRKSFSQEQKQELLRFYDAATEFRYEFLAVNFGNFPQDEGQSLYEYQQNFHVKVTELLKIYQRLVIYLEKGQQALNLAQELVALSLEADKVMRAKFYPLKKSFVNESIAYAEAKNSGFKEHFERAVDDTDKANKEFWDQMKPITHKYVDQYGAYLTELNVYLNAGKQT